MQLTEKLKRACTSVKAESRPLRGCHTFIWWSREGPYRNLAMSWNYLWESEAHGTHKHSERELVSFWKFSEPQKHQNSEGDKREPQEEKRRNGRREAELQNNMAVKLTAMLYTERRSGVHSACTSGEQGVGSLHEKAIGGGKEMEIAAGENFGQWE